MKEVSLSTDYQIGEGEVTLSIRVGDAQVGASVVRVNAVVKGKGDIDMLAIGRGPSLKGKRLIIKTVVADVNDATNHTSVRYVLKGGKQDQEFVSSAMVDASGDSILYRAEFSLKS